jgi:hypothetical protein
MSMLRLRSLITNIDSKTLAYIVVVAKYKFERLRVLGGYLLRTGSGSVRSAAEPLLPRSNFLPLSYKRKLSFYIYSNWNAK